MVDEVEVLATPASSWVKSMVKLAASTEDSKIRRGRNFRLIFEAWASVLLGSCPVSTLCAAPLASMPLSWRFLHDVAGTSFNELGGFHSWAVFCGCSTEERRTLKLSRWVESERRPRSARHLGPLHCPIR